MHCRNFKNVKRDEERDDNNDDTSVGSDGGSTGSDGGGGGCEMSVGMMIRKTQRKEDEEGRFTQ